MSIEEVRAQLQAAQIMVVDQYEIAGSLLGFTSQQVAPMVASALRGSGRPEADEIVRACESIPPAARELHQALGYTMGLIERFLSEL